MDKRISKRQIYFIRSEDLDDIFEERFGRKILVDLDLHLRDGLSSCLSFVKLSSLAVWEQEKLSRFMKGSNEIGMTRVLLQLMVNRDMIPEGQYFIG